MRSFFRPSDTPGTVPDIIYGKFMDRFLTIVDIIVYN